MHWLVHFFHGVAHIQPAAFEIPGLKWHLLDSSRSPCTQTIEKVNHNIVFETGHLLDLGMIGDRLLLLTQTVLRYYMYVTPHLEYCVQVWILSTPRKYIDEGNKTCTWPWEKDMNRDSKIWDYSQHRRRSRGDLIEAYKILRPTCKENIDSSLLFQKASTTDLRGHSLKYVQKVISTRHQKIF